LKKSTHLWVLSVDTEPKEHVGLPIIRGGFSTSAKSNQKIPTAFAARRAMLL
jgi:hypothetical protein